MGIMEMDFVLRRNDIPGLQGFRRPVSCGGEEEFRRALGYFGEIHGEAGGQGDQGRMGRRRANLDRFSRSVHAELANGLEWNQPLDTPRFEPTRSELGLERRKFSEVEVQADSSLTTDKAGPDHPRRHFP